MNAEAHIVVGYDGSPDSLAALAWGANLASRQGQALVAVTIIDPRQTPRGVSWPESYWDDLESKGRQVLEGWPEVAAQFVRHRGHLVPQLLESALASSMLVVGSHGHGLVVELFRGSVSHSAARHATVPVVVVRPAVSAESGWVVVGVDGSDPSRRALEFGCQLAQATDSKLRALRAWQPAQLAAGRYGYVPPLPGDELADAESDLRRIVDDLRAAHPDIAIEGEMVRGAPERALVEAADGASLVVVGTRGHTPVGEVFLGSVSESVLKKAHCPIAIVH